MQRGVGLISDIPTRRLTLYCSPQTACMAWSRALPPAILPPRKERRGTNQVSSFKSKGYSHYWAEDILPKPNGRCRAGGREVFSRKAKLLLTPKNLLSLTTPCPGDSRGVSQGTGHGSFLAIWSPFEVVLGLQQSWTSKKIRTTERWPEKLALQREKLGDKLLRPCSRAGGGRSFPAQTSSPDNCNIHRGWRDINCK